MRSRELRYEFTEGGERIRPPFTVLVDTREQKPWTFGGINGEGRYAGNVIEVPTQRCRLVDGDYSVGFFGLEIAIERKSKEDLYSSVVKRDNFEGRLARMDTKRRELGDYSYFAVVVEAELNDCLHNPPHYSRLNPKALNRTVMAWRQRYRVDWYFLPGREFSEKYVYRMFERFYLDSFPSTQLSTLCDSMPTQPANS